MNTYTSQRGYSLIEVLIALTILMIAIVAPITIAVKSIESSRYTLEQNTAVFLAQETISMIDAWRNQYALINFNQGEFSDEAPYWNDWVHDLDKCRSSSGDGCNFDAEDPLTVLDDPNNKIIPCNADGENCRLYYKEDWPYSTYRVINTDGGEPSPYIRRVYLDELDDGHMTIRTVVEWETDFESDVQQVSVTSALYNTYGSSFVQ